MAQLQPTILQKLWKEYSLIFHIVALIITVTAAMVFNKDRLDAHASQLSDHESRLRVIENTLAVTQGEIHEIHAAVVGHPYNH